MFAYITISNDFFTALGLKGFYMSNFSKFLTAALYSVTIFYLKKRETNLQR